MPLLKLTSRMPSVGQRKIVESPGPGAWAARRPGRACGMPPTRCMPRSLKSKARDSSRPSADRHQRTGKARRQAAQSAQQGEQPQAQGDGGKMGAAQLEGEIRRGTQEAVGSDGEPGQLAQLADDQVQRHPGEEPHEHGLGEEVGDEAETEGAGGYAGQARPQWRRPRRPRCAGPPPAMPRPSRALATIMQVAVSGPIMSRREGPKRA